MQSNSVSLFDFTFSAADLVFAAAILLVLAALLLIFSSRRKVALQESLVTEELLILLSRIANALEVQSARPPERLIADLAAALKQQNNASPSASPQPAALPSRNNEPVDAVPGPMHFPLFNGRMPPDR